MVYSIIYNLNFLWSEFIGYFFPSEKVVLKATVSNFQSFFSLSFAVILSNIQFSVIFIIPSFFVHRSSNLIYLKVNFYIERKKILKNYFIKAYVIISNGMGLGYGREAQKGGDVCTCIADPPGCEQKLIQHWKAMMLQYKMSYGAILVF